MGGSSSGNSGSADNPTTRRHTVTQVRKSPLAKVGDFVKSGGVTGMVVRGVKGSIEQNRINQLTSQFKGEEGTTRTIT